MASTRMRSGKLRFMVPIVGDEARHGRARLAWWQHTGVGTTEGGQRNRAPASCRSGEAAARARAGEAEEGSTETEVKVDARGAGVGQDAVLVVDDEDGVLPNSGSAGIYLHLGLGAALLGLAGACARRRFA